jgi:hypothetical protein
MTPMRDLPVVQNHVASKQTPSVRSKGGLEATCARSSKSEGGCRNPPSCRAQGGLRPSGRALRGPGRLQSALCAEDEVRIFWHGLDRDNWTYLGGAAAECLCRAILEAGTQATVELTRASVPAAKVADTTRIPRRAHLICLVGRRKLK